MDSKVSRPVQQPVWIETFDDAINGHVEAAINPVDGSLEIDRIIDGETTDGIRLSFAALLLLEPLLTGHIRAKMKELGRTRTALRSWAKRLHTREVGQAGAVTPAKGTP